MALNVCFIALQLKHYWHENPERVSCDISQIAAELKMSRRTLQRKLKEENTCYLSLQDSARLDLTMTFFAAGKSVSEVSETLGFANRRCFTRAFKRWTGESPKTYKK